MNTIVAKHSISFVRKAGWVLLGTLILAFCAQVALPIGPVPVTLQTLAVVAIGLFYGPALAAATMIAYLVEGALGLPVFAQFEAGVPVLLGMKGGYLLAFPFAAALAGFLYQYFKLKNFFLVTGVCFLASALILLLGMLQLSLFIGMSSAYLFGVKPFILTEGLKAIIAASLIMPFRK